MPAAKPQSRQTLEKIADVFRALSEPTRLAIIQELKAGPQPVGSLVEALDLSQANVSKQLRILFEAGFLSREKHGTQVRYAISDDMLLPLCELVCKRLNRRVREQLPHYAI